MARSHYLYRAPPATGATRPTAKTSIWKSEEPGPNHEVCSHAKTSRRVQYLNRQVRQIAPRQSTFLPRELDDDRKFSGLTSPEQSSRNTTPFNPLAHSRQPIADR